MERGAEGLADTGRSTCDEGDFGGFRHENRLLQGVDKANNQKLSLITSTEELPLSSDASPATRRNSARPYHHGDLRAACLALAAHELEARGPEGLALRHLAAQLGVTQPSLYRHFASKEELVDRLATSGFVRVQDDLAAAAGATARDRLEAMVRAYLACGRTHPQHYRLMFARPSSEKQRDPLLVEAAAAARQMLDEAVAAWRAETGPAAGDSQALSAGIWALAHGMVMLASEGHLPGSTEALCAAVLDRLLGPANGCSDAGGAGPASPT
jgi:AcrR family transcriptional regulator